MLYLCKNVKTFVEFLLRKERKSIDTEERRCYNISCYMRGCWNRQTGTFEVRVSNGVGVQVPSLAPKSRVTDFSVTLLFCSGDMDLPP